MNLNFMTLTSFVSYDDTNIPNVLTIYMFNDINLNVEIDKWKRKNLSIEKHYQLVGMRKTEKGCFTTFFAAEFTSSLELPLQKLQ